jgi:hypothetical protein
VRLPEQAIECRVFTFKEGALRALGHDLEFAVRCNRFEIDGDGGIDASFDAASMTVLHAIEDGRPSSSLSESDKRKIVASATVDVLDVKHYPEIRFRTSKVVREADGFRLSGELRLHGQTRSLEVVTRLVEGKQEAHVRVHQADYGIKPFSAMLGALKIKADVDVHVRAAIPESLSERITGLPKGGSDA